MGSGELCRWMARWVDENFLCIEKIINNGASEPAYPHPTSGASD